MKPLFTTRKNRSQPKGVALVVVLAAVVLTCIITLAFFNQSTLNKQISFSSAGQLRAENVARLGIATIVGDLRSEIVAGSTLYTSNGTTLYLPTTNLNSTPSLIAAEDFPNVVKRSAGGSNLWSGNSYSTSLVNLVRAVAGNSSTNTSANGRYISENRWNAPYLLGTNLPAGFKAPDWILVTRNGALTNGNDLPALSVLADNNVDNSDYVIGRFAYFIYDEGGLLDVNVAGFPSNVPAEFISKRGLLPQADLGKIPGVTDANAIVQWRNQTTAATAGAYTSHILTSTNGFMSTSSGDQIYVSRQDLIKYAKSNPNQLTLGALQYLGTFSRELNAPSFTPPPLDSSSLSRRPPVLSGNFASGKDDQYNPSLVNTRVKEAFTRDSDGTIAEAGEPLLKYRFPLSRLGTIKRTATASLTDGIYKSFGLTRSSPSAPWVYNHGSANRILTLDEVATQKREPDFFELLQAAIRVGSLGQSANDAYSNVSNFDKNVCNQIIQIGVNMIDQYDSDSYPTRISFNGTEFSGIESLPYLSRIFVVGLRPNKPKFPDIGLWYQPELWNPHANAGTPNASPMRFRFRSLGNAMGFLATTGNASYNNSPVKALAGGIEFVLSSPSLFSVPAILTPNLVDISTVASEDIITDFNGYQFIGKHIVTWTAPDKNYDSTATTGYASVGLRPQGTGVSHILEYQDESGNWIKYTEMRNTMVSLQMSAYPENAKTYKPQVHFLHSDPRTDRFGISLGVTAFTGPLGLTTPYTSNPTIRPDAAIGASQQSAASPGWTGSATPAYFGQLAENKPTSTTRYADPDGLLRRADGAYTDGTITNGGYPLATDSFSIQNSRPIILNRPFRSVAEIGYVFRDMPWKHIDLFTTESGDASLLDVFCLNEPARPPIEAGRLSLNTRQKPVLAAAISGVIKAEEANTTVSDSDGETFAGNLLNLTGGAGTGQGPLLNRSELVTRWMDALPADTPDSIIKRRRESVIRALSDIGNTRTWNLLIDIIAQSGRYTKSAQGLSQFTVEGERRMWLHIAIDRYTNKIISQQLEPVYE